MENLAVIQEVVDRMDGEFMYKGYYKSLYLDAQNKIREFNLSPNAEFSEEFVDKYKFICGIDITKNPIHNDYKEYGIPAMWTDIISKRIEQIQEKTLDSKDNNNINLKKMTKDELVKFSSDKNFGYFQTKDIVIEKAEDQGFSVFQKEYLADGDWDPILESKKKIDIDECLKIFNSPEFTAIEWNRKKIESFRNGKDNNNINFNGGNAMKATTIMAGTSGLEIKAGESKGVIKEGEKSDYEVKKGEIYVRAFEHPGKDGKNQKENYGNTIMKLSPQEAYKLAGAFKTVAETQEAKQSLYPLSPHEFEKDGKTTETIIAISKDAFKDKAGNDRETCVLSIGKGEKGSKANEKTWLKVNMSKDDALYLSDFTKALAVEQSYENSRKVEKTQSQGMER